MAVEEYKEQSMTKAFTFIEVLIMVAIIGILTAVVFPVFQENIKQAKEASAQDNLRILRNTIEYYASQHDGIPPGYPMNNPENEVVVGGATFFVQLVLNDNYLTKIPENPFNERHQVKLIPDASGFPDGPEETDTYGWLYKPGTKEIRLNWSGADSKGVAYFDY